MASDSTLHPPSYHAVSMSIAKSESQSCLPDLDEVIHSVMSLLGECKPLVSSCICAMLG